MPSESATKIPAGTPALVPVGQYAGSPPLPLNRMATVAGTREGCHLRLVSSTVSQIHALIVTGKDGVYVRDFASRTHVLVNGKAVKEQFLENGDDVQIGRFTFKYASNKAKFKPADEVPSGALAVGNEAPRAIDGRVMLIGARTGCDIVVSNDRVSRCHAVVFFSAGQWHVRDLGSRTGTKVNGKPVRKADLSFGDVIRIGGVDLHFGAMTAPDDLEHLIGTASLMPEDEEPAAPMAEVGPVQRRTPTPIPALPPPPATIAPPPPPPPPPAAPEPSLDEIELETSDSGGTSVLPVVAETPPVKPTLAEQVVDEPIPLTEIDEPIPLQPEDQPAAEPAAVSKEEADLFQARRGWRRTEQIAPPEVVTPVPLAETPVEEPVAEVPVEAPVAEAPAEIPAIEPAVEAPAEWLDEPPIGFVPHAAEETAPASAETVGSLDDLDFSQAPAATIAPPPEEVAPEPQGIPDFDVPEPVAEAPEPKPEPPTTATVAEDVATPPPANVFSTEPIAPLESDVDAVPVEEESAAPEPAPEATPESPPVAESDVLELDDLLAISEPAETAPPQVEQPIASEEPAAEPEVIPIEDTAATPEPLQIESPTIEELAPVEAEPELIPIEEPAPPIAPAAEAPASEPVEPEPELIPLDEPTSPAPAPEAMEPEPIEPPPIEEPELIPSEESTPPAAAVEPQPIEALPSSIDDLAPLMDETPAVEETIAPDPIELTPAESQPAEPAPIAEDPAPVATVAADAATPSSTSESTETDTFDDFLAELDEPPGSDTAVSADQETSATAGIQAGDATGDLLDDVGSILPEETEPAEKPPEPVDSSPPAPTTETPPIQPPLALAGQSIEVDISDRILEPEPAESLEPSPVNELDGIDFSALRLDADQNVAPEPEMGELLSSEPAHDVMDSHIRFDGADEEEHPDHEAVEPAVSVEHEEEEEPQPIELDLKPEEPPPVATAHTVTFSDPLAGDTEEAAQLSFSPPPPSPAPDTPAVVSIDQESRFEPAPPAPPAPRAPHEGDWIFDDHAAAEADIPPLPPTAPSLPLPRGIRTATGAISELLANLGTSGTAELHAAAQIGATVAAAVMARRALSAAIQLGDGFFSAAAGSIPPPPRVSPHVPLDRPELGLNDTFFEPPSRAGMSMEAPTAFIGGMPANLPELEGPPEHFGRVAVSFGGKTFGRQPDELPRSVVPEFPVDEAPASPAPPPSAEAPKTPPPATPRRFSTVPKAQPLQRRRTPFATDPLDLGDDAVVGPPAYMPPYEGGGITRSPAGAFDGLASSGAMVADPFGGTAVQPMAETAAGGIDGAGGAAEAGGVEELPQENLDLVEDFASSEFWDRADDDQSEAPVRKVEKDLAPEIPAADAPEPVADLGELGIDDLPDEEPAAGSGGGAPPMATVAEPAGDPDSQGERKPAASERNTAVWSGQPARPMVGHRRRRTVPILMGTMVLSMVAVVGGIAFWPIQSQVEGTLSFQNGPYPATNEYNTFETHEMQWLALDETRQIAERNLQYQHPDLTLDAVDYQRLISHPSFVPGKMAKDTDLILDASGRDATGDSAKVLAILQAMYAQNDKLRSDYTTAMEEVDRLTSQLKQGDSDAQDAQDQLTRYQTIIDGAAAAPQPPDISGAEQKYQLALAQLIKDQGTLRQLDAQLTPSTQPAVAAADDPELLDLQSQIASTQDHITRLQAISAGTPEPQARAALASAEDDFDQKLSAAEDALKGTDFAVAIDVMRGMYSDIRALTEQGMQGEVDRLSQLIETRREMDENLKRKQQAAYDADPQMRELRDELEADRHKLGAADAAGLTNRDRAVIRSDMDRLETQLAAREHDLAIDPDASVRQGLSDLIASAQDQIKTDKARIADGLKNSANRLNNLVSAAGNLTNAQKKAVNDLQHSFQQLADAHDAYAEAAAGMDSDTESLDSYQKELDDLKIREKAREKMLAGAAGTLTPDQRDEMKQERDDVAKRLASDQADVDQAFAQVNQLAGQVAAAQEEIASVRDARDKVAVLRNKLAALQRQPSLWQSQLQASQQAAQSATDVTKPDDSMVRIVANDKTLKFNYIVGSMLGLAVVFGALTVAMANPRRPREVPAATAGG